jgi:hypothetical protein
MTAVPVLDYGECIVDGCPAIELFDARTGTPLAFAPLPDGAAPEHVAELMIFAYQVGKLQPCIVAEPLGSVSI